MNTAKKKKEKMTENKAKSLSDCSSFLFLKKMELKAKGGGVEKKPFGGGRQNETS